MTTKKWNISWEISSTNEWNAEQDRGRSVAETNALLISKHPEWEEKRDIGIL